jgi:DNA-binding response OmpR family regulator
VSSAHEARAGFHLLAEESPALVLLDATRGGAGGVELLRDLRLRDHAIGIILLGRDEEDARIVSLESGADDYVSKPFSTRELVARVRRLAPPGGRSAADDHGVPAAAVPHDARRRRDLGRVAPTPGLGL